MTWFYGLEWSARPGEQMQVDFGQGAWIEAEGKRRRLHLFRAVLSHSRRGYSDVVWRQDTETFIPMLRKRVPALWRGHPHHDRRQPQGRRPGPGLVRSEPQSEDGGLRPLLRHGRLADAALPARAQGEDRGGRKVRPEQRPQGPHLRLACRAKPVPERSGAPRRRHPYSRHGAPACGCAVHLGATPSASTAGAGATIAALRSSGFDFYWSWTRGGKPTLRRRTTGKKFVWALTDLKEWQQRHRHERLRTVAAVLRSRLLGHYNYYGVIGNATGLGAYGQGVQRVWFRQLNHRSQRHSYNWTGFNEMWQSLCMPSPCVVERPYLPPKLTAMLDAILAKPHTYCG